MKCLPAALTAAFAALPASADGYWEYRDWRAFSETIDTGEDLRRTCTAVTGGDGLPSLSLTITNGDAGPPAAYPEPRLHESAPRGHPTQVQDGLAVAFVFDRQAAYYGIADGWLDEEGFAHAEAGPRWKDALAMLRWMKAGQSLEIRLLHPYQEGPVVMTASLSGFTAAYGKMMDECGFTIELPAG
jgi:hypothetical protein